VKCRGAYRDHQRDPSGDGRQGGRLRRRTLAALTRERGLVVGGYEGEEEMQGEIGQRNRKSDRGVPACRRDLGEKAKNQNRATCSREGIQGQLSEKTGFKEEKGPEYYHPSKTNRIEISANRGGHCTTSQKGSRNLSNERKKAFPCLKR